MYFEARKRRDLYLWLSGVDGPSAKFHVQQIRPMRDMRLTGNCLLGSRPILSFVRQRASNPPGGRSRTDCSSGWEPRPALPIPMASGASPCSLDRNLDAHTRMLDCGAILLLCRTALSRPSRTCEC